MNEAHSSRRIGRSIGAVLAGMFSGIILTLGTDAVLHAIHVFPPWASLARNGLSHCLRCSGQLHHRAPCARSAHAARLGGRIRRPCREHLGCRRDVEQGTGLRAALVSCRARWCSRCRRPGPAANSALCSCAPPSTAEGSPHRPERTQERPLIERVPIVAVLARVSLSQKGQAKKLRAQPPLGLLRPFN